MMSRQPAGAGGLRLRLSRDIKADLRPGRRSPAAPTSSPASCSAPTLPVWRGEIQCRGLRMAVDGLDDDGKPVRRREGRAGVHRALPGDADRLLERRPTAPSTTPPTSSASPASGATATTTELTAHDGLVIYGGVPTPRSTRAACASAPPEIYRQVELHEVVESLVIGQDWPPGRRRAWCCS